MKKIEKGFPIPVIDESSRGRPYKYPWLDMEVGDSFLIEDSTPAYVYSLIKNRERVDGRKYVRKAQGDSDVRVWRVK